MKNSTLYNTSEKSSLVFNNFKVIKFTNPRYKNTLKYFITNLIYFKPIMFVNYFYERLKYYSLRGIIILWITKYSWLIIDGSVD